MISQLNISNSLPNACRDYMDFQITSRIGYWPSINIDNYMIPFRQPFNPLVINSLEKMA